MNKKLVTIGIVVLLICVGLSGCDESEDEGDKEESTDQAISVNIEATAQVINTTTWKPVPDFSVDFNIIVNNYILATDVRITDSTGYTPWVTGSVQLPYQGTLVVEVFPTNGGTGEIYTLTYSEAKANLVDKMYIWSLSPMLYVE